MPKTSKVNIVLIMSAVIIAGIISFLPGDLPVYAQQPDETPPAVEPTAPVTQPEKPLEQPQQPSPPQVQPAPAPQPPVSQPPQPPVPAPPQLFPPPPAVLPQPKPEMPQPVAPKPPAAKKGDVSFNFDDADVYSVIQTIFGDVLKVNYIVDPAVKGRVTFRSVAPVAKEDVLPLMEIILRLNGIGIVEEAGLYRIIPIADLPREPSSVGVGREAEDVIVSGKALVQVIPVRYIQTSEMVRVLTPFLSKNAVIVDVPKSNYIIVVDTDVNVKRLLQLVSIFDSEELKQVTPQVFVYPVQNSKAKDVAALLQQIFLGAKPTAAPAAAKPTTPTTPTRPGQPAAAQPAAAQPTAAQPAAAAAPGAAEPLVSEVTRIIPDEITNTITILATPEDYALMYETIQKIDIVPRQVIIEGLIARVDLTDNLSFGFSWALKSDINITNMKPFSRDINLTGNMGTNVGQIADAIAGKVPGTGFAFVGTDPTNNVRAVITALAEESKAKVLAAPHILVSDNREARIQVGRQIPIATSTTSTPISGTATTTGVTSVATSTIQYKDIGIILKVKPQVNDSGLVSLEITQEISSIGEPVTVGGLNEISINKTEATTNLVAQDGETIIIGGLIQEDISKAKDGIPFLSKIPIIGHLFGNTTDNKTRTELIILLTPHVARSQQEAKDVTSDYVERYEGTTKDKEINEFIKERGRKEKKESNSGADNSKQEAP